MRRRCVLYPDVLEPWYGCCLGTLMNMCELRSPVCVTPVCVCSCRRRARACVSYLEATQLTRVHNSRSLPISQPSVESLSLRL